MLGIAAVEGISILAVVAVLGIVSHAGQTRELEAAERTAMESQARAIGEAVQARLGSLEAQAREVEIAHLARGNPVDLLAVPPSNYLGVLQTAPAGGAALGVWYFDESAGELVYLVRRGRHFVPDAGGRRQVRFRIELVEADRGDARASVGAVFRPVAAYRWR